MSIRVTAFSNVHLGAGPIPGCTFYTSLGLYLQGHNVRSRFHRCIHEKRRETVEKFSNTHSKLIDIKVVICSAHNMICLPTLFPHDYDHLFITEMIFIPVFLRKFFCRVGSMVVSNGALAETL